MVFGYSMHQEEVRRDIVDYLQREYSWGVVEKGYYLASWLGLWIKFGCASIKRC